ncbi:Mur ligase [Infundibulicybe gibba]|nr:Mur ligase [Infundibulicybe gibba]
MSIDLTLERIGRLMRYLPTYTRPTCHIAGTNGKGSVASILSSILESSVPALSVGRFNSPHLVSIYDCIMVAGKPVEPAVYHSARNAIELKDQEHGTKLSSFEILTLTALRIFEQEKLDIVVVEVGMGGKNDATNAIPDEAIFVSALTSVDLDHQLFLGNTVAEIALEKAGIARSGKPFVLGPQKHLSVYDVVRARVGKELFGAIMVAEDTNPLMGKPHILSFRASAFNPPPPQPIRASMPCFPSEIHALMPLYGSHQLDNLGTALTVVSLLLTHPACIKLGLSHRITPKTVSAGIHSVRWPGRLSFHRISVTPSSDRPKRLVVLADGAHNPASSLTLGTYISHLLSSLPLKHKVLKVTYILALSDSPPKTPLQTLTPILPPNTNLTLQLRVALLRFSTPEGMPWVRSVAPSRIQQDVRELVPKLAEHDIWVADDGTPEQLPSALKWTAEWMQQGDDEEESESLVVLAGSLYLVADFYRLLDAATSTATERAATLQYLHLKGMPLLLSLMGRRRRAPRLKRGLQFLRHEFKANVCAITPPQWGSRGSSHSYNIFALRE